MLGAISSLWVPNFHLQTLEYQVMTGLILRAILKLQCTGPFLKLGQNVGLLAGAAFWGVGADI